MALFNLTPPPRQDKELTGFVWQEWFRQLYSGIAGITGTANKVPKFSATNSLVDSSRTDDGTTVTDTLPVVFSDKITVSASVNKASKFGDTDSSSIAVSDNGDRVAIHKATASNLTTRALLAINDWTSTTNSTLGVSGFNSFCYHKGSGNLTAISNSGGLCGGRMGVRISSTGSGTVSLMTGLSMGCAALTSASCTVTEVNQIQIEGSGFAGITSTYYRGINVRAPTSYGSCGAMFGIYVDSHIHGTANYGIYVEPNEFGIHVVGGGTHGITVKGYAAGDDVAFGSAHEAHIYYDATDLVINPKLVGAGGLNVKGRVRTEGYTVAQLAALTPVIGDRAYVTNLAAAPAYLAAVGAGGGAIVAPVFYNGAAWVTG